MYVILEDGAVMFNRRTLIKLAAALMAALIILAAGVVIFQYKQADYIFHGKMVAATVLETKDGEEDGSKDVKVIYLNDSGEEIYAKAVLKEKAKAGDKLNLFVTKKHTDVLYQIPSRSMIVMFDAVLLFVEFLGWSMVMRLLRKLRKYKKLEKKGIKAQATITAVKNTSGVLGADIEFTDSEGGRRTTVYYPTSDIPAVGDKLDIIYYIKKTGKIVFLVPKDE